MRRKAPKIIFEWDDMDFSRIAFKRKRRADYLVIFIDVS